MASTNKSTRSGSDAMSGTHLQPSIVSLTGLTMTIARVVSFAIRLLTMM